MSGGAFDYQQRNLAYELFGWRLTVDYGEDGHAQSKEARKVNPMNDRELSELVWDVLCLIHSLDWCKSGDTGDGDYASDVKWFKDKWLPRTQEDVIQAYKQDLRDFADELIREIGGDEHASGA